MTTSNGPCRVSRRALLQTAVATTAVLGAAADAKADKKRYAARPPAGMVRLSLPGRVVKVSSTNTLQANGLWPTQSAAKKMLARAMTELTGKSDLGKAFGQFVHPSDVVAIKPNGIAGKKRPTMASNKELILEIVHGLIAAGVRPDNITIFEQYASHLRGTRVVDRKMKIDPAFPKGVKTAVHRTRDAVMGAIKVAGFRTKFVRPFTEATAVIDVGMIKDHSITGYTGCLKNITHGSTINPEQYHKRRSSQIAQLYAHEVVKSRVVLHITDAYKVMYDGGPLDRKPSCRIPYHAIYVGTDPVAMDLLGWQLVDELRKKNKLPTLKAAGREPSYIRVAGQLGLGVFDQAKIHLSEVTV